MRGSSWCSKSWSARTSGEAQTRELVREVDEAIAAGRRHLAWSVLVEHVRGGTELAGTRALAVRDQNTVVGSLRATAPPELVTRLQQLEHALVRSDRLELAWGGASGERVTSVRMTDSVTIGRSPVADLSLADARVSRDHVRLSVDGRGERPRLVAIDQGSRIGTFWEGEPLDPGEPMPIEEPGELGLGLGAALEVAPVRGPTGNIVGGLVRSPPSERWLLFVPGGGPLWLSPEIKVPATVLVNRGLATIDLARGVGATPARCCDREGMQRRADARRHPVLGGRTALPGGSSVNTQWALDMVGDTDEVPLVAVAGEVIRRFQRRRHQSHRSCRSSLDSRTRFGAASRCRRCWPSFGI